MSVEEKRVDVALAEFNALRAEILAKANAGYALLGVGLTALAVIVGFVVKEQGDERLLLAVPPLAAVINLLQASIAFRISSLGIYIQRELWPYLQRAVGDKTLPNWEGRVGGRARRWWWWVLLVLFVDAAATVLFAAASVVALTEAGHLDDGLRKLGWVLTVFAVVVPALLAAIPAWCRRTGKKQTG